MQKSSQQLWLATVAVMAGLLAGCDGPTGLDREQEIEFRTDHGSYALGDTLALTLTNHGPRSISPLQLLHCGPEMDRLVNSSWESVDAPMGDVCLLGNSAPLEPGKSLERQIPITIENFQPGAEYRLRVEPGWIEGEDLVTTEVRSNPFTIDPFLPGAG